MAGAAVPLALRARAVDTVEALELDAVQLRALADQDPRFGHALAGQLLRMLLDRLQATRALFLEVREVRPMTETEENAMMYWFGGGMWGYVLMLVSMVLIWVLLGLGVVALYRYLRQPGGSTPRAGESEEPEQLLAQRFARGEIDEGEYQHDVSVLRDTISR